MFDLKPQFKTLFPETGRLDPAGARELQDQVHRSFCKTMRWVYVLCYAYVLLFTAVAVLAAVWFFRSQAVKDLALYAAVFLAAFVTVVAMKMWFWVMNNKLLILREIKLLAIQLAARCPSP